MTIVGGGGDFRMSAFDVEVYRLCYREADIMSRSKLWVGRRPLSLTVRDRARRGSNELLVQSRAFLIRPGPGICLTRCVQS